MDASDCNLGFVPKGPGSHLFCAHKSRARVGGLSGYATLGTLGYMKNCRGSQKMEPSKREISLPIRATLGLRGVELMDPVNPSRVSL